MSVYRFSVEVEQQLHLTLMMVGVEAYGALLLRYHSQLHLLANSHDSIPVMLSHQTPPPNPL